MSNNRCKNGCTYSKSMFQTYPRSCVYCGKLEYDLDKKEPKKYFFKNLPETLSEETLEKLCHEACVSDIPSFVKFIKDNFKNGVKVV